MELRQLRYFVAAADEHRQVSDGGQVRGVFRQSMMLASGRFAMQDDGVGFSLVPWKPVLEERLGQTVSGVLRGGSASWDFTSTRFRGEVIHDSS